MNEKTLKQLLIEDGEGLDLAQTLNAWSPPEPSKLETAQLLTLLEAEMPLPRVTRSWQQNVAWVWALLGAQSQVIRSGLWIGSALVLSLGLILTISSGAPAMLFALLAPLVVAVGVTLLYGEEDTVSEILLATAVSPRLILLTRLCLLFGFNLLLCLLASTVLALFRPDVVLGSLIHLWLAPMTGLSALALLITMLTLEPLAGILVSLLLWMVQVGHSLELFSLRYIPNWHTADQTGLWVFAVGALLTAVWLSGQTERTLTLKGDFS